MSKIGRILGRAGTTTADDVFAWLSPMAAARLAEDVPSEEADLLLLAGVTGTDL
jgi:hypothetical protein